MLSNKKTRIGRRKALGDYNKRIFKIWSNMRTRCQNKNSHNYHNYGGRGIKVCDEWQDSITFYNWAINNGYEDHLQIDRIDNNKNYEPSNCKWVTHHENQLNKRRRYKNESCR